MNRALRIPLPPPTANRLEDVRALRRLLNQVEKGKVHIESLQTGWQTEPFPGAVPVWRATLTLAAHVYSGNGKHRHRRFRGKRGRR